MLKFTQWIVYFNWKNSAWKWFSSCTSM